MVIIGKKLIFDDVKISEIRNNDKMDYFYRE